MCVIQDFETITPNLLARTIETVEGGGIVVLLLKTMTSLRQLYTMTMESHDRLRTESHQDVVGRFNERFLLSLGHCQECLVLDDELNILPISSHARGIKPFQRDEDTDLTPEQQELADLKRSLADTQPVGALVNVAKTVDQARAVLTFVEAISEKTLRSTVALTAGRGRGKSSALGVAIAAAVAHGYSNIFVTSPTPENLKTLFEFVFKAFDALNYTEHADYELVQSTNPDFNKAIVRVNVFRSHRQTIQYIAPQDWQKLGQAELVVIDEAAAIPLPLVKKLLGPYLVFLSSTVNGYEGTGRALSHKLIKQLREQGRATTDTSMSTGTAAAASEASLPSAGRVFRDISLDEPIRYASGDGVEKWLNNLLCLDANEHIPRIISGMPHPSECELYYVERDTLLSHHKASEEFLQRMMGLYVSSHYKNTPDDLQLLADAPAHHLFVLLGPVSQSQNTLPDLLCVMQVCFEGAISKESVAASLARGLKNAGDMIPWTISTQFQEQTFASLSGARVVRIATHPELQRMGYGQRALDQLAAYYSGQLASAQEEDDDDLRAAKSTAAEEELGDLLTEKLRPRKGLPPLLTQLSDRRAENLSWLGVGFGLTPQLHKFWTKSGYKPVYLRQNTNDLTGEHTTMMLKPLQEDARVVRITLFAAQHLLWSPCLTQCCLVSSG
jgi:N-acetyltransferase 10